MNQIIRTGADKRLIAGSKVPIAYLIDYIKEGRTMFDFLDAYPWLKMNDVKRALDEIKQNAFTSMYAF